MNARAAGAARPHRSSSPFREPGSPGSASRRFALAAALVVACAALALAAPAAAHPDDVALTLNNDGSGSNPVVNVKVRPGLDTFTVTWNHTGGDAVDIWQVSIATDNFLYWSIQSSSDTSVTFSRTTDNSRAQLVSDTSYIIWVLLLASDSSSWSRYRGVVSTASDATVPGYSSAEVNGSTLTVSFDEALATDHVPAAARFTVSGGDSPPTVTGFAFKSDDPSKVELTLGRKVEYGETGLTLAYTPHRTDASKRLQDASGNEVLAFSNRRVTNRTPNNPPRVLEVRDPAVGGNSCRVKTDSGPQGSVVRAEVVAEHGPFTTRVSTDTGEFPASCTRTGNTAVPIFDDRDADRLTVTMRYTIPDNVFVRHAPLLVQPSAPDDPNDAGKLKKDGGVFFSGSAARELTNVRIDLTARDPFGASASTHVLFSVPYVGDGSSAPSLPEVATQRVEVDERASIQLPAATGGDVMVETATGDDVELVTGGTEGMRTVFYDYDYEVSGLPAGLAFDAATRTISGTPTAAGSFSVTYTAEDADGTLTDADKASRSFALEVSDDAAPVLQAATVDGASLVLAYDEDLAGSAPPAGAFTVTVAGANRTVNMVSLSGSAVTLTLASPVAAGQFVAVSYTAANAGAQPIRDAGSNNAADLVSRAVTNSTAAASQFVASSSNGVPPGVPETATATTGPGAGEVTVAWTDPPFPPAVTLWSVGARLHGTHGMFTLVAGCHSETSSRSCVGSGLTAGAAYDLELTIGAGGPNFRKLRATNVAAGTGPPMLRTATVEGARLVLAYDKVLSGLPPPARAFVVTVGGSSRGVNGVQLDGASVVLTLASPVSPGQSVAVSYTAADAGDEPLRDAQGNRAADLTNQAVTHGDFTAPTLVRAEVRGSELELVFDEVLKGTWATDPPPAPSPDAVAFTVGANGVSVSVSNTAYKFSRRNSIFLQLSRAVSEGETVTVGYDPDSVPAAHNKIQDHAGNPARGFQNQAVRSEFTAPALSSAVVEGTSLVLTYGEALGGTAPPPAAFAVTVAGTDRGVDSVSLSGTAVTLTLSSAVASGETVTVSYTAADAGDEPLRDAQGNRAADLTNQAVTHGDFTAPTLVRAEVRGSELELVFDEVLKGTWATDPPPAPSPDAVAFTVGANGVSVSVSNTAYKFLRRNSIFLQLSRAVSEGETVTVGYDPDSVPAAHNKIQDHAGNPARGFQNQAVRSEFTAPALSSAVVEGTSLVLTYGEALGGTAPPPAAFAVTVAGTDRGVDSVSLSGTAVTLTLSSAVASGETVTVSYTAADAGDEPLRDAQGNRAADLTNQAVTHGDFTAPTLVRAEVRGSELELVFDEVLKGTWATDPPPAPSPDAVAFTVGANGVSVSVSNTAYKFLRRNSIFLQLSRAVSEGETVTVGYDPDSVPAAHNKIQDHAGNPARGFQNQAVRSEFTAPALSSAVVEGTSLVLTYGEALGGTAPPPAAFAVTVAGADRGVDSVSLSGTAVTLTLSSAVASGETVTVSYTAADAGDEPLRDAQGNRAADLTNQAVTHGDFTAPTLVRAEVRGSELELVFDEVLKGTWATDPPPAPSPDAAAFTVGANGVSVSVSNTAYKFSRRNSIFLQLSRAVSEGETVTVGYDPDSVPAAHNKIQDHAGNPARGFQNQAVRSEFTAPALSSAVVEGTLLVLTYGEALGGTAPPPAAFAVTVAGTDRGVDSVSLSGTAVTLTLSSAVASGETVTVSYTAADAGDEPLRDAQGNRAADLTNQAVTHGDFTAPTLVRAEVRGSELELVFDEVLKGTWATDPPPAPSPDAVAFTVGANGVSVSVSNTAYKFLRRNSIFLQLSRAVSEGETVTVGYDPDSVPAAHNKIQDHAGNPARGFQNQAVRSEFTAPALSSAQVDGTSLVLTYDEALAGTAPPAAAFAVTVAGADRGVDSVDLNGARVTLTLAPAAAATREAVAVSSVSYTAADAGDQPIRDAQGNKAADLVDYPVTHARLPTGSGQFTSVRENGTDPPDVPATAIAVSGPAEGQITVKWTDAAAGPAVTSWDVITQRGEEIAYACQSATSARSCTAAGLTPGAAYLVQLILHHDVGTNLSSRALEATGVVAADAPTLSTAAADGAALTLTYDEALGGSAPPPAAFAVTVDGAARGVDRVSLSGTAVTLTLASPVAAGEAVTVSYTAADAGGQPLRDADGYLSADLTSRAVANNTLPPGGAQFAHFSRVGSEPPDAPLSAVAVPGPGSGEITVRWRDVNTGPRVMAWGVETGIGDGVLTAKCSETTARVCTATGLTPGTAYTVRLSLFNGTSRRVLQARNVLAGDGVLTLSSATVEGTRLVLTYARALGGSAPPAGAFAVTVAGASRGVSGVELGGTAVTLTLASPVAPGETVTVSYTAADAGDEPIRDAQGNNAADLVNQAVTHVDTTPPELSTAAVDGDSLVLTYDEALAGTAPPAGAFSVAVAGESRTVNTVSLSGSTVTLTLASAVTAGEAVTVTYTAANAGAQPIRDAAGNPAADLVGRGVTNQTASQFRVITTQGPTPPNTPASASAVPGPGDGQITVSWTQGPTPPRVQGWHVKHRPHGRGDPFAVSAGCASQPQGPQGSCTATGLVPGAAYDVQLQLGSGSSHILLQADNVVALDATGPLLSAAAVDGAALTLTYGEALAGAAPPAAAFAVTVAGEDRGVDGVALEGMAVTLTLASAVAAGETVTVSYAAAKAGANPIRDAVGNPAASLTSRKATNKTDATDLEPGQTTGTPPNVTATATSGPRWRQITVEWEAEDEPAVTGWDLWSREHGSGAAYAQVGQNLMPDVDSLTFERPKAGTGYDLRLVFYAGAGNSLRLEKEDVPSGDADETPPALSTATVDGAALTLTWDEPLQTAAPLAAAFAVTVAGGARGVSGVEVNGAAVVLTLASAVTPGQAVTVTYTAASAGANPIKDEAGNPAPDLSGETVRNDTLPEISVRASAPRIAETGAASFEARLSAAVNGTVTAAYALGGTATHGTDYATLPAVATGTLTFPPGQTLQRITVTAAADDLEESDETVTVSLSNPSNATLSATAGSASLTIADYVPTAGVAEVIGVALVSDPGSDRTYAPGDTVRVALTFSEAVNVGSGYGPNDSEGKPRLKIELDPSMGTRRAVYESGSGTDRLVFAYTLKAWDMVPTGGNAAGGIGVAANTLELNCGWIESAVSGGWARLEHRGLPHDANHLLTVGDPDLTGDTAWPQWVDAWLDGTLLTIEFDESLDPDHTPPGSAFAVVKTGGIRREWRGTGTAEVADSEVRVTLAGPVVYERGHLTVYYDVGAAGGSGLRDLAGNWVPENGRPDGRWGVRDNSPPVMAQQAQAVEGAALEFQVELVEPPTSPATVDYETEDGTAEAGRDYEAASGTLSFAAGETVKTVRVRTLPDRDAEGGETLRMRLSNPVGLKLAEGGAEATGTITDARGEGAPAVALVSDPGPHGVYGAGDTIRVGLTFGEAMEVDTAGGTPRLRIKLDPEHGEKWAVYESGSGTAELAFAFGPVAPPDHSPRGVAVLADTLELAGGAIRSAATGAAAELGHAGLDHDAGHRVDSGAPALAEAAVDGTALTLTFDEALDPDSAPAGSAFTVAATPAGGESREIAGTGTAVVGEDGVEVAVTLASAVVRGETATVSYAAPGDAPLRDLAGNPAADFSGEAAANGTAAADAPEVTSATVDGGALALVFDGALDTASAPAGSAFAVTATDAEDSSRTIAGTGTAAFGGADGEVAVTLASAVADGETLTVAYAAPEDSPLQDPDGNAVADFGGVAAENATAAAGRPAVASVALTSTPAIDADGDGTPDTYGRGETVEVTVTWNAEVTWDLSAPGSKMRVRLDVGSGETRPAELATDGAAEGTARSLRFRYDVYRTDAAPDGLFPVPAADGAMVVLAGGATLKGAGGRHARRAHAALAADPLHKVDGGREPEAAQAAAVASVALTSTPAVDADGDGEPDTYGRGETVEVTVTWDADVTWDLSAAGAKMRVRLDVGGAEKGADLVTDGQATGTARTLAFRYETQRTDAAPDGVFPTPAADGSLVVVRGGATLKDAEGGDAARAHAALAADANHKVDGARDASAPQPGVVSAALVSDPGAHGVYGRGDAIRVALTFSEAVDVDTAGGTPSVLLKFDRDPTYPKKETRYESGSGSDTLVFAFGPVAPPNHSSHGVALLADTLALYGGAIRSVDSLQEAALPHPGLDHDAGHRIDSVLPFVESATVDGGVLTVVFDEDLDPGAPPAGSAFTVMIVDGVPPRRIDGTGTAAVDGAAATVALASEARWGETLRAYYDPDGVDPARDLAGNAAPALLELPAENLTPRSNRPATGAPTITGLAEVGQTLAASADAVADEDGMDSAVLAWQWMSNGGGADEDIAGATASTYELVEADEGRTVRVRVSFTDDAGFPEALGSEPTAPVAARPLTAAFEDVPEEHDGKHAEFSFGLVFSEDFPGRFDYNALKEAFVVENGRTVGAKRAAQGQNQRWTITVRPWSHEAVTVSLPAGSVETERGRPFANTPSATVAGPPGLSVADAEADEGAGARMEFAVTLDRAPRSAVSVDWATADGTAKAGEDYEAGSGTLAFAAGETSGTVSVVLLDDVIDDDGETFRLLLSNAAGAHIADGEATGTIRNTDPLPRALLARFGRAAAVHIVDTVEERMTAARTPGFEGRVAGRQVRPGMEREMALGFLQQLGAAAGCGMPGAGYGAPGLAGMGASGGMGMAGGTGQPASGARGMGGGMGRRGSGGMGMACGMGMSGGTGHPASGARGVGGGGMGMSGGLGMSRGMGHPASGMPGMGGGMGMAGGGLGMADGMGTPPMGGMADPAGGSRHGGLLSMGLGGDLLTGSSFALNRETRRGGILSLWSRGAHSSFFGQEGELGLRGDVRTTMLGADYASGPMTVGLSLARSWGLGAYDGPASGEVASSVTGLYPWLGYRLTERLSVWGVGGYGRGGMLLTPQGATRIESGLSMKMMAAGTRGELVAGGAAGFTLAFKADALRVVTASDEVDGPDGRLAATSAAVSRLRTALEGSRGFTVRGRLSLTPSVEVGLRHDAGDAEQGAGMDLGGGLALSDAKTGLTVDVRVRTLLVHEAEGFSERGASVSLSWNPTPQTPLGLTAKVAPSWGGQAMGGAEALWGRETMAGMAQAGYAAGNRLDAELGYGLPLGSRFVGTPLLGVSNSAHGREYRLRYSLEALETRSVTFELGVEAQRRENAMQGEASNAALGQASLGW